MLRRLFWLGLGLGAGAASALVASRWFRRTTDRFGPGHLARNAQEGVLDLAKRLAASMEEGRRFAQQRERQIREAAKLD